MVLLLFLSGIFGKSNTSVPVCSELERGDSGWEGVTQHLVRLIWLVQTNRHKSWEAYFLCLHLIGGDANSSNFLRQVMIKICYLDKTRVENTLMLSKFSEIGFI